MTTIVEPQESLSKLWGRQIITGNGIYRLMRYVLRVDKDDYILLHNIVTGQLVMLDQREINLLDSLPTIYSQEMDALISGYFLVEKDYDECQQVKNLRLILRRLEGSQKKPIKWYTILPTTACNARCYYCFEKGARITTMTNHTAEQVVRFIDEHCGDDKSIYITWFGGEPTVAADRIDQICEGLRLRDIHFNSSISTNGYLFDDDLVWRAANLWNLKFAQICVDGNEESYNSIKNFVNAKDNPYQRVMHNIGLLLEKGIRVGLRMNFDLSNFSEFKEIIRDSIERFGYNRNLHVNAYPVIGEHVNRDGEIIHGSDSWLIESYSELNTLARQCGVATERYDLPYLEYIGCDADNRMSVTITPEGSLVRCCERFAEDEWTGNVFEGITKPDLVNAWTKTVSYKKCEECVMYPKCLRLVNCVAKDRCYFMNEKKRKTMEAMRQAHADWLLKKDRGGI